RLLERRRRRLEGAARARLVGREPIGGLGGDDLALEQALAALVVQARERVLRASPLDLAAPALDLGLEGPRVGAEQELPALHARAVLKMHGLDEARDPRPHLDAVPLFEAPRELFPFVQRARDHR